MSTIIIGFYAKRCNWYKEMQRKMKKKGFSTLKWSLSDHWRPPHRQEQLVASSGDRARSASCSEGWRPSAEFGGLSATCQQTHL